MPRGGHLGCFLVLLCASITITDGEVVRGELNSMDSWKFVSRFCFLQCSNYDASTGACDDEVSQIKYELTLPSHSAVDILVYTSSYQNWTEVYNSRLTCHERVHRAAYRRRIGTGITRDYTPATGYRIVGDVSNTSGASPANTSSTFDWKTESGTIGIMALHKPRWFFVVIAHCNPHATGLPWDVEVQDSLRVRYSMTMTNAMEESDRYHYHFSADEQGILQQELAFFVLQCLLVVFCYSESQALMKKRMFHYTVQLLAASVALQWLGIVFKMVYFFHFADTGIRKRLYYRLGAVATGLADMALLLMLILLAKGWTIVRSKISASGRIKIAVYMTSYFVIFWMMLIWSEVGFDPADILYIYQSGPGKFLIFLRVFAACWLLHAACTTMTNYHAKRHFYSKFVLGAFLWVISMPVLAGFCHLADNYVRAKIMNGCELAFTFAAQAFLVGMYYPDMSCNKSFPFHAEHNPHVKRGHRQAQLRKWFTKGSFRTPRGKSTQSPGKL